MNWAIILNYVNQTADAEEQRQVESWVDNQPGNQQLLAYLQKRRQQLNQPLKKDDIEEQWLRLLNRIFELNTTGIKHSKPITFFRLIGIAASLLLISLAGLVYFKAKDPAAPLQTVTLQTPVNQHGRVNLPDGTQVFMAPATRLTYTSAFGVQRREVKLTGEAFFKVKHLTKQPFIVYTTTRAAITVLGTSFNVYSRQADNTEVKVASGKVGVTIHNSTRFLQAGQQLSYQPSPHHFEIKTIDQHEAAALSAETLLFKNNSAVEIAAQLQRWYNIKVIALPSAQKHARFSGEMKDDGISNVLRGLSYATGIHYRYQNSNTLLLF